MSSVRIGAYSVEVATLGGSFAQFEPEPETENARALEAALEEEAGKPPAPVAALEQFEETADEVTGRIEQADKLLRTAAAGKLLQLDNVTGEVDALLDLFARLDRAGRFDEELKLMRALGGLLTLTLRWLDLIRSLRSLLRSADAAQHAAGQAYAHHELGSLNLCAGRTEAAEQHLREAFRLQSEIGDLTGQYATRHNLDSARRDALPRSASARPRRRLGAGVAVGAAIATLASRVQPWRRSGRTARSSGTDSDEERGGTGGGTPDSGALAGATPAPSYDIRVGDVSGEGIAIGSQAQVAFMVATPPEDGRVLNVALTDAEERLLPEAEALLPERDYFVRIDIGSQAPESVVVNPKRIPTELLDPSSSEGFWLDVLVVSSDVDAAPDLHHLFLPFTGPSWVCDCEGEEHVCSVDERRPFLHVPIRTRAAAGAATLRCTVYDHNNAVQSVRVDFTVGEGATRDKIRGMVDFQLAEYVGDWWSYEPRTLSVLTNESAGGTHKIVVNSGERAIAVDLTEREGEAALSELRGKLREITVGANGSPPYDEQNRRKTDAFLQDLKQLALLGSILWGAVVPSRDDRRYLREQLAHRATIQIARVGRVVFPWALVYDIPRELDEQWRLCPLLEQWDATRAELAGYPQNCPYAAAHRANVLCPYGFWGFKHLIEQPASVRQGVLRTVIDVLTPGRGAAARSLGLDQALTSEHFTELQGCLEGRFDLSTCDSRTALREAFADPSLPLVYFYCHGKTAELAGTSLEVPFLEIGGDDKIGPNDFAAWDEDDNWGPSHWATTAPLVFINGCETTKLSPEDLVTFVDALAGMNAAGVIGTEIPVRQRVAGEVALGFYRRFAGGSNATVGEALYLTRIDLLAKGNVSGLVYTPFCSMDLALSHWSN